VFQNKKKRHFNICFKRRLKPAFPFSTVFGCSPHFCCNSNADFSCRFNVTLSQDLEQVMGSLLMGIGETLPIIATPPREWRCCVTLIIEAEASSSTNYIFSSTRKPLVPILECGPCWMGKPPASSNSDFHQTPALWTSKRRLVLLGWGWGFAEVDIYIYIWCSLHILWRTRKTGSCWFAFLLVCIWEVNKRICDEKMESVVSPGYYPAMLTEDRESISCIQNEQVRRFVFLLVDSPDSMSFWLMMDRSICSL